MGRTVEHISAVIQRQDKHTNKGHSLERCHLGDLLDDAVRMSQVETSETVRLVRVLSDLPALLLDREQVMQILVNLLVNALQALEETGRTDAEIRIEVEAHGADTLAIHVIDNGIGICPDSLQKLFQVGYTTKKKGSGLGLHDSANAASAMGGRLYAISEGKGHGACFTLELPLKRADIQSAA